MTAGWAQMTSEVTMYTTTWCGYCRRLKKAMNAHGVGYTEVDIDGDRAAADYVASVNRGNRTVPTVRFADGSTLTNPGVREVTGRLAELARSG